MEVGRIWIPKVRLHSRLRRVDCSKTFREEKKIKEDFYLDFNTKNKTIRTEKWNCDNSQTKIWQFHWFDSIWVNFL